MRTSVLFLASAIALCLVLPYCSARPGSEAYVKKQSAQQQSASSAAEQSSSEQVVKAGGCGCGKGASYSASKKQSSKNAASSSSSSSSSYEARIVDSGKKELTEAEIKEVYAKKGEESLEDYFKRITSKSYSWTSTTESYIKTLNTVRKDFAKLDLWYDRKYINFVKEYYNAVYAKQESESLEAYYSRIIKRESWESDELFAKRITIIRDCFPKLDLWISDKWFNQYTKSLYALEFKKYEKESDEEYVNRIFEKDSFFDISDEIWAKRVFLIQEATISSCSLWYSEKYVEYFKKFYSVFYKKSEKETCDGWLLRALTPLPGESLDNAIKRVKFIKEVTGDCGCWKSEYFSKIQQAKSLQECWLEKVKTAFFPCGCGGAVTVERSSSKKSSAASASSAESSSESSVVKKSG